MGTPINLPLGVNNGWTPGGSPEPILQLEFGPSHELDWFVQALTSGPLPEVKLHAFDLWRAWVVANSGLQDDLRVHLIAYVHLEAFDLDIGYARGEQATMPTFTETVSVPEWSWAIGIDYFADDWSLASVQVAPAEIGGNDLVLGPCSVSADGQAEGLKDYMLEEHAMTVLDALVTDTVEQRLKESPLPVGLFFEDFVFEANPLLAESVPGESRQVLAVDRVETDQSWWESGLCAEVADQTGLAVIAEAEVFDPALADNTEVVTAEGPGFREILLDDALAQAVASALQLGSLGANPEATVVDLLGSRDDDLAGELRSVLDTTHLGGLLDDFLEGYLAWAYSPDIDDFGCVELATQAEAACLLMPEPADWSLDPADWVVERSNLCDWMANDLSSQCDVPATWDVDQPVTGPDRLRTTAETRVQNNIGRLQELDQDGADEVIDMLQELQVSPSQGLYDQIMAQLADMEQNGPPEEQAAVQDIIGYLSVLNLNLLAYPNPLTFDELPLHLCGSVQGVEVDVILGPGAADDPLCGDVEPRFETDLGAGEVALLAGQCAMAEVTLSLDMNIVIYDTNIHDDFHFMNGGACPSLFIDSDTRHPRTALRMGSENDPGPLWGPALGDGPVSGVFSADIEMDLQLPLGVTAGWDIPLRRHDTIVDQEEMVGWDSVEDWYEPMMREADLVTSLDGGVDGLPSARTDVSVGFEAGGVSAVADSGFVDVVRGSVAQVCNVYANPWVCLVLTTGVAANGDLSFPGSESTLVGQYLDELSLTEQLPEPYAFTLENYPPTLLAEDYQAHILPRAPNDPLSAGFTDDEGMSVTFVGLLLDYMGLAPEQAGDLHDYSLLVSMHTSTEAERRSMINTVAPNAPGLPNTAVWAIQALAYGLRLDEAGWPTREAAWRVIMDEACSTLDVSGAASPVVDCTDDILVEVVGPTWAGGGAGAIWLFRPTSDLPLYSGAPWKPGRLPAP